MTEKVSESKKEKSGFRTFLDQYSVLPLAIGVVVGTAVSDLVKSLVDGLITPLISLIMPETDLATFEVTVRNSTFKIGAFFDGLLSFLIIAAVVYFVAAYILRDEKLVKKS